MTNQLKTKTDILSYLYENNDPDTLLNNPKLVMLSESTDLMNSLNMLIKHSNVTTEQLSNILYTVESFLDRIIECNISIAENTQLNWMKLRESASNRIMLENSMDCLGKRQYLDRCTGLDTKAVDNEGSYGRIAHLITNNKDEVERFMRNLEKMESEGTALSLKTLEDLFILIMNKWGDAFSDTEPYKEFIREKIKDTLIYQKKNPDTQDLPYVKGLYYLKDLLDKKYCSPFDVDSKNICESLFNVVEEAVSEFEASSDVMGTLESFNPGAVYSLNGLTPMDGMCRKIDDICINIAMSEDDEEITEELCEFARLITLCEFYGEEMEDVTEAGKLAKKIRGVARKSSKGVSRIDRMKRAGKNTKDAAKKVTDPLSKLIDKTAREIKEADSKERRKQIINGGVVNKTLRLVRRYIEVAGANMLFGPTVAGIVLIGRLATDKHMDKKERAKVLRELEAELKIVREKIEDSKGDENKKAKYELMRIENKLQYQIDKIRYNLKY